jgi:hypothetical protein
MKRFAIFQCPDPPHQGGMNDFIGAFDNLKDAELFVSKASYSELIIEDMEDYLARNSPYIRQVDDNKYIAIGSTGEYLWGIEND